MADMTYGELRASSVRVEEDVPVKDFELAVSELIQMYRGRVAKAKVVDSLVYQSQLVVEDDGWAEPGPSNEPETEEAEEEAHEASATDDGDTPPAA